MSGIVLLTYRLSPVLYSEASGMKSVQVVLFELSMRLFHLVPSCMLCNYGCMYVLLLSVCLYVVIVMSFA